MRVREFAHRAPAARRHIAAIAAIAACVLAGPVPLSAATPDRLEAQTLEEIIVQGRRGLEPLRQRMIRLEDAFYARFNALNSDDRYDVHCAEEARTGTRLVRRYCRANFEAAAHRREGQEYAAALEDAQVRVPPRPWVQPLPATVAIEYRREAFRAEMLRLTARHPELLDLLRRRAALDEQYEKLRRESFGDDRAEE